MQHALLLHTFCTPIHNIGKMLTSDQCREINHKTEEISSQLFAHKSFMFVKKSILYLACEPWRSLLNMDRFSTSKGFSSVVSLFISNDCFSGVKQFKFPHKEFKVVAFSYSKDCCPETVEELVDLLRVSTSKKQKKIEVSINYNLSTIIWNLSIVKIFFRKQLQMIKNLR